MGQEHSAPCDLHHHHQHNHIGIKASLSSSYSNGTTSSSVSANSHTSHSSNSSRLTTSSKYSRNPDPCIRRSKGSVSSGSGSSVSRTQSTASADSRNSVLPIYTNIHYRDVNNNDIYKPLKIGKNKIHKLKLLDADKDTADYLEKHLSIKSYLDKEEVKKINEGPPLPKPALKKSGIRNYTPKILTEKNTQKDLEHWI